ncbi:uncharacterized protein BDZ99DRAFT_553600 [Mytilinidion resinicola]|uniref:Uncharacterized protein n=1 Tax=Mytilinidion resinicola TaxID=574789 RepID=A0A6A6YZ01_9PEZI|nr:uncharacterized protein BDZ99DRAFT_553600 [Mytilinidion resinicola]KAF2813729.1 hypothetical protein BDZ99DRAFT_553600 [Mytilinidion resinicola]
MEGVVQCFQYPSQVLRGYQRAATSIDPSQLPAVPLYTNLHRKTQDSDAQSLSSSDTDIMARWTVKKAVDGLASTYNLVQRFLGASVPGRRIVPRQNEKNDGQVQVRLDTGEKVDGRFLTIYLQANKQASASTLLKFIKKYGTHENLAVGKFDTKAEDLDAEVERVCNDMVEQAEKKL